ncbi:MAG: nitroreductase family protein [Chloroflexi bacterium]|nr:nitroreductase family protein [Chloroflexota bacterium]
MTEQTGIFDVMYTQRAVRYFRPDPVPEDAVRKVLDAAIRAPSGGNSQQWFFLVVRDPGTRGRLGQIYKDIWFPRWGTEERQHHLRGKVYTDSYYLAGHLADAPVHILAFLRIGPPPAGDSPQERERLRSTAGSSIYPAVQNLLLAARALGLGTTLTTIIKYREGDVKALLGAPEDVELFALIPLGYPAEGHGFGPNRRRPVEEVTYSERWGNPMPGPRA